MIQCIQCMLSSCFSLVESSIRKFFMNTENLSPEILDLLITRYFIAILSPSDGGFRNYRSPAYFTGPVLCQIHGGSHQLILSNCSVDQLTSGCSKLSTVHNHVNYLRCSTVSALITFHNRDLF